MRNERSKSNLAKARQLKREGRIDFSDSPELTDEWFNNATFGPRTPKVMLSMRVDADILEFLRMNIGPGYQRVIHELLRRFVEVKKAEIQADSSETSVVKAKVIPTKAAKSSQSQAATRKIRKRDMR